MPKNVIETTGYKMSRDLMLHDVYFYFYSKFNVRNKIKRNELDKNQIVFNV